MHNHDRENKLAHMPYNPPMTAYPPLHPTDANFAAIRARNGLYVDKTPHFRHLLAAEGGDVLAQPELAVRHQLLLRPRRFGKTLLINTLEAWFQGLPPERATIRPSRDITLPDSPDGWSSPAWLWQGLDAEDWHGTHGWHPVIRLDMSRSAPSTPKGMRQSLQNYLWGVVETWGNRTGAWQTDRLSSLPDLEPPLLLEHLAQRLNRVYGVRPVVLVDEYDAPLTRFMGTEHDPADAAPDLRDLYRVLKDDAGLLYGVFVTGITRLARQHLFSVANNFVDISADEPYATLCGFTDEEVDVCLSPHRDALRDLEPAFDDGRMLAAWRDMYNGYRFARHPDTERVYNPFTLTNGLHHTLTNADDRHKAMQDRWPSAWSATGHPGLAVRLAADTRQSLPPGVREGAAPPSPSERSLDNLRRPDFARLMQDTGYYTWHGGDGGREPYLDFPNREVAVYWFKDILDLWDERDRPNAADLLKDMGNCLHICDVQGFADLLETFYSGLAYHNLDSKACFRAVLQTLCLQIADNLRTEKPSWGGRSDLEVVVGEYIYVMEVKHSRDGNSADSVAEAMKQIRNRPYGREHLHGKRNVLAVGLAFHKDENTGVHLECGHRDLRELLRERTADTDTPRIRRRHRFAGPL